MKTDTNPYSWPYPTHEVGADPNQPTGVKSGEIFSKGSNLWRGDVPDSCLFKNGYK